MSQRRLAGKRPHKHGAYDIFSFVRGPQVRFGIHELSSPFFIASRSAGSRNQCTEIIPKSFPWPHRFCRLLQKTTLTARAYWTAKPLALSLANRPSYRNAPNSGRNETRSMSGTLSPQDMPVMWT